MCQVSIDWRARAEKAEAELANWNAAVHGQTPEELERSISLGVDDALRLWQTRAEKVEAELIAVRDQAKTTITTMGDSLGAMRDRALVAEAELQKINRALQTATVEMGGVLRFESPPHWDVVYAAIHDVKPKYVEIDPFYAGPPCGAVDRTGKMTCVLNPNHLPPHGCGRGREEEWYD